MGQERGSQWGVGISMMECLGGHRLYRYIKQKCLSVCLSVCPSRLEKGEGLPREMGRVDRKEGEKEGVGQWEGAISTRLKGFWQGRLGRGFHRWNA